MYDKIISDINKLLDESDKEIVIVSIDGSSASGKSYLADILNQNFCCNLFRMDDFFLTPQLRTPERLSEIGGNVDYDRFALEVLENIMHKSDFSYGVFDCRTLVTSPTEKIFHKRLNIVEGVYSDHPTLVDYYDYKIFLSVEGDKQVERISARNSEFLLNRFVTEWIPMENKYFEKLCIKEACDIAVDTTKLY